MDTNFSNFCFGIVRRFHDHDDIWGYKTVLNLAQHSELRIKCKNIQSKTMIYEWYINIPRMNMERVSQLLDSDLKAGADGDIARCQDRS